VLWAAKTARNGKMWQRRGTVGGKSGNGMMTFDHIHVAPLAVAIRRDRHACVRMRLFKALAAPDGLALVELNYHKWSEVSREKLTPNHPP